MNYTECLPDFIEQQLHKDCKSKSPLSLHIKPNSKYAGTVLLPFCGPKQWANTTYKGYYNK